MALVTWILVQATLLVMFAGFFVLIYLMFEQGFKGLLLDGALVVALSFVHQEGRRVKKECHLPSLARAVAVLVVFVLTGTGCGSGGNPVALNDDNPVAPSGGLLITSVGPTHARPGTTVYLLGGGFLTSNLGHPTVLFKFGRFEVGAAPLEASNTELQVAMPTDIVETIGVGGALTVTVQRDGLSSNSVPMTAITRAYYDGNYAGTMTGPNGAVTIEFNIDSTFFTTRPPHAPNPSQTTKNLLYAWPGTSFSPDRFGCADWSLHFVHSDPVRDPPPSALVNLKDSDHPCLAPRFPLDHPSGTFDSAACFVSATRIEGGTMDRKKSRDTSSPEPECNDTYQWTADRVDRLQIDEFSVLTDKWRNIP